MSDATDDAETVREFILAQEEPSDFALVALAGLERHIAAQGARAAVLGKERDEQHQRAERAEANHRWEMEARGQCLLKIQQMEREAVAAVADNAALLQFVGSVMKAAQPWEWMINRARNLTLAAHPGAALLEELQTLRAKHIQAEADRHAVHEALMWAGEWPLNMPPPSRAITALLEEHRKALVRARNDGLERAAQALLAKRDAILRGVKPGTRKGGLEEAASIVRAMKEPEQ